MTKISYIHNLITLHRGMFANDLVNISFNNTAIDIVELYDKYSK